MEFPFPGVVKVAHLLARGTFPEVGSSFGSTQAFKNFPISVNKQTQAQGPAP